MRDQPVTFDESPPASPVRSRPRPAGADLPVDLANPPPAPPKRHRVRSLIVSGLIVGVMVAGVAAVKMLPDPPPAPPPAPVPPKLVRVRVIQPQEFVDSFTLPGVVEANRVVNVSAEVAGRIEKICVTEGQAGKAGQVLIELNTDLLQADLDRAKAQSEFDQRELEKMKGLADRGVATLAELDLSRTKAAASKAALDTAQANRVRATIHLPIDGVINTIPVEEGEYVTAGKPVAQIVDIDTVKIVVDVPEKDSPWIRLGQEERIFVDGPLAREIAGKITYVSELADTRTRSSRVEIAAPNAMRDGGRLFRSGQILRVEVRRRVVPDGILIPLEAVIPQENAGLASYAVYVVQDGHAVRRSVRLGVLKGSIAQPGLLSETQVQIVEGLAAGDRLIVANQRYVGPGQAVTVVE